MVDIGSVFAGVVEWVLVPLVLVLLWGYGFASLPKGAATESAKKAARAARWAGLVLFVLFILWRRGRGDAFLPTMPNYRVDLGVLAIAAVGAVIGFMFLRVVDLLKGTKAFPFAVLVLVSLMSVALYTYFFVWSSRAMIIFSSLGFALGTLLNRAFTVFSAEAAEGPKTKL